MTDRDALLAELDAGVWLTMRALADEAEESGEPWLANGWRWLADNRKLPLRNLVTNSGVDHWLWSGMSDRDANREQASHKLPRAVADLLPTSEPGIGGHCLSLSACLLAGATAVGRWLADESEREARRLADEKRRRDMADCRLCGGTGWVTFKSSGICDPCPKHPPGKTPGASLAGPPAEANYASLFTALQVFMDRTLPVKEPQRMIRGTS